MKKNLLVVDDSALMRRIICDIINSDQNFQATDYCRDGLEAYEKLKTKSYDGVVLDVNMPRMGGLQLLERLQKEHIKAKVVMVSTLTTKDADVTILAMERGAIDFVTKPNNIIEAKGEDFKRQLLSVLTAVYETQQWNSVHTISSLTKKKISASNNRIKAVNPGKKLDAETKTITAKKGDTTVNMTVGTKVATVNSKEVQLDAPVVIVQHMPAGFTQSMAKRLDEISEIPVKEAQEGDRLENGHVYIAPGGRHLEVRRMGDGSHVIKLNDMPPIGGLKPCANIMYDSLTGSGYDEIVCVVLTGMGADGTNGILSLEKSKPIHVIAQDAQSCVVYGMPKAIAEAGVVDEVVSLNQVAKTITKNVGEK